MERTLSDKDIEVKVESIRNSMNSYKKKDIEAKRRASSPVIDDTIQDDIIENEPLEADYVSVAYYELLSILRSANVTFEKIGDERFLTLRFVDCAKNKNDYVDKILEIVKEI